jgi:hypothetical protein
MRAFSKRVDGCTVCSGTTALSSCPPAAPPSAPTNTLLAGASTAVGGTLLSSRNSLTGSASAPQRSDVRPRRSLRRSGAQQRVSKRAPCVVTENGAAQAQDVPGGQVGDERAARTGGDAHGRHARARHGRKHLQRGRLARQRQQRLAGQPQLVQRLAVQLAQLVRVAVQEAATRCTRTHTHAHTTSAVRVSQWTLLQKRRHRARRTARHPSG